MANYAQLKAAVDQYIKTNGNNEITGAILNDVLNTIITSLGTNYQFAGVATPSTNPQTPDQNVFYLASEAGVYTNFGGLYIPQGISVLKYNGTWTLQTVRNEGNDLSEIFKTENTPISVPMTSGKVIYNTGSITVPVTYTDYANGKCCIQPCKEGQIFVFQGVGLTSARIWSFHDASGNLILCAPAEYLGAKTKREIVVAPAGSAYFIYNTLTSGFSGVSSIMFDVWTNGNFEGVVSDINKEQEVSMLLGAKYAGFADAQPTVDANYKIIDLIVKPKEKFLIHQEAGTKNVYTRYLFFDSSKNAIGGSKYFIEGWNELIVPDDAAYLRVQLYNNANNRIFRHQFGCNDIRTSALVGGFDTNIISHYALYNSSVPDTESSWGYFLGNTKRARTVLMSDILLGTTISYKLTEGYQIAIGVYGAYPEKLSSGWLVDSGYYTIPNKYPNAKIVISFKKVVNGSEQDIDVTDVPLKCIVMSAENQNLQELDSMLNINKETEYQYEGKRPDFLNRYYTKVLMNLNSMRNPQGGVVFDDTLISVMALDESNTPTDTNAHVHSLKDGSLINQFKIDCGDYYPAHANEVCWGNDYPSGNTQFPALYLSQLNNNGNGYNNTDSEFGVLVFSLSKNASNEYSATMIQAIIPDKTDAELMAAIGEGTPNYVVDTDNGVMYIIGYKIGGWFVSGNTMMVTKVTLPALTDGVSVTMQNGVTIKQYTLDAGDILDHYEFPMAPLSGMQMILYHHNRLYVQQGESPVYGVIKVINLETKEIETQITTHIPKEPQFIGLYNGRLIWYTATNTVSPTNLPLYGFIFR